MLLNITGGEELNLHEVNEAANIAVEQADSGANVIFGTVIDPTMGDEVRVTVIATGFEGPRDACARAAPRPRARRPPLGQLAGRPRAPRPHRRRRGHRRPRLPARRPRGRPQRRRLACGGCPTFAARPFSTPMRRRVRGWFRSRAGRCPSSTRGSGPSTWQSAPAAESSTSPTWARSRPRGRAPRTSSSACSRTTSRRSTSAAPSTRCSAARTAASSTTSSPTGSPTIAS